MRAASIAIVAVSRSRISPISTMSGSARRIERSADAKVSPAFGFTWIWLTPASRYSTGSSTVMMFRSTLVEDVERRVQRGRLARAGRARHEDRAVRLPERRSRTARRRPRQEAEVGELEQGVASCPGSRITIFSPYTVGSVASRRSRALAADPHARCGRPAGSRFSAMFRSAMTFRRLISPPWMLLGEVHDLVEHAVDAEPDRGRRSRSARCARPTLGRRRPAS